MARPSLELADVFRCYGAAFQKANAPLLSLPVRRVMKAIESCRTAALGGHIDRCDSCGHETLSYNSCRNRHCPKCLGSARIKWLEARLRELLPVPYFHVVFTLPPAIAEIAFQNKRVVYGLLFRAASDALLTLARDEKRLGAHIGFFAVLHTWTRTLLHHPHLHCVIPGGGLSLDRQRWVASRKKFFLPVRVLSPLFRRLFLTGLKAAFDEGRLHLHGALSHLSDPAAFGQCLAKARVPDWVVFIKHPFGGPDHVLRYLGRYTHRVALSNDRILDIADGSVTFRYKDTRHGHQIRTMTLAADEFIRRFLLHVLPERFVKIRHFGLFASRTRTKALALCRALLDTSPQSPPSDTHAWPICPSCAKGRMLVISLVAPHSTLTVRPPDSS
jgi:hypothetical protein